MQSQARLKILHILSQRPDSTGSGIYLQAMVHEATACGHANFVIAGIQSDREPELDGIRPDQCRFVRFNGGDIAHPIPGMTDIMPYPHTRFSDLSAAELKTYEAVFTRILTATVAAFNPDVIHSHHLWIVTSLTRRLFPQIPLVTSCHGTDLRQFQNCPHLRAQVLSGCSRLDAALALNRVQKQDIESITDCRRTGWRISEPVTMIACSTRAPNPLLKRFSWFMPANSPGPKDCPGC
jgi:hypothetical protein